MNLDFTDNFADAAESMLRIYEEDKAAARAKFERDSKDITDAYHLALRPFIDEYHSAVLRAKRNYVQTVMEPNSGT